MRYEWCISSSRGRPACPECPISCSITFLTIFLQHIPQEESPRFALDALAASATAFGAMVIDVTANAHALDEVEQELQEQEGQDSVERRALAFDLARDHGSRWMR